MSRAWTIAFIVLAVFAALQAGDIFFGHRSLVDEYGDSTDSGYLLTFYSVIIGTVVAYHVQRRSKANEASVIERERIAYERGLAERPGDDVSRSS